MLLQIDTLPESHKDPSLTSSKINLYIDGFCYELLASKSTVDSMVRNNLISKTFGQRHNAKGELEKFDYENGVDSSGVEYTSEEFKLIKISSISILGIDEMNNVKLYPRDKNLPNISTHRNREND